MLLQSAKCVIIYGLNKFIHASFVFLDRFV
jgi:hypothetical protein